MHYIDLAEDMQNYNVNFILYPNAWKKFKWPKSLSIKKGIWKEIKYIENGKLNNEINKISNKKGGIYLFIIKSPILPQVSEYLSYIGRAQLSTHHNLRIRVKKYINEYTSSNDRPKIVRMMDKWSEHLYLKFIEIDDNKTIKTLEARLINSVLPPFNDEIPEKKFRKAIKAFK